ncbi:TetR/AcrR family transcriptional regulator [Sandaracinobacter neustonicus]|uniref:TetR/AcrR family transcriptional regulator n=1 Tax=Sandaracinobacter neustonicus TaxID=1715348 RepID=A0A501XT14_9SPHN|nr:TetR/AcrR family transcriptional regulator [Sandaracinobacter neustonicus]TPE63720.1 TetR/AcrR family transcriptional regulator [Sandaracinobacter neustonicus]
MEADTAPVQKGRPREFCTDRALAAALQVFWSKGYEGASLTDLTEAMGITRPSLYAAFGNKEALFRKTLDLYETEKLDYVGKALAEPTARAVAEHFMRGALENQTRKSEPHGCLDVIASVACGEEAASIREEVLARGATARRKLVERMQRARDEGDLPEQIDPESITSYLYAVLQGMAVQAGAGASREELERLVETALLIWPSH